MRLLAYIIDTETECPSHYLPKMRDASRTQLEYDGGLPAYEDEADHYTQYQRATNAFI